MSDTDRSSLHQAKANELNICLFDEYFVFLQQSL